MKHLGVEFTYIDTKTRKFYSNYLSTHENNHQDAIDYANAIDWSECEAREDSVAFLKYVGTTGEVDVWHCYGMDEYYFSESE